MSHRFAELMFTPTVKAVQERQGSRGAYERFEEPDAPAQDRLGEGERAFIAARDSFYMATVSETGWPYVQHRGGPPGFLKVLDDRTLGFADYRGNRQYVSVGNLMTDDRVSLFLVDYPNRRRLKILGRARIVDLKSEPETIARLRDEDYDARIERGMIIRVEGYDWNCPQHITPRYTEAQIAAMTAPLLARLQAAEARIAGSAQTATELGSGPLPLVIAGIRQLTPRVRAYELRARDGGDLPPFTAGAHLAVPVHIDGREHTRRYSISADPVRRDRYEIAVLADGEGSRAIHRDYALGVTLRCSLPLNAFALHDDDRPALLIAGGIGITPLKAMAETLIRDGRDVRLHQAARSRTEAPYSDDLVATLGPRVEQHFGPQSRLDIGATLDRAPPDSVVYVCGPQRMIDAVRAAARARAWPEDLVRFERFASPAAQADDRPLTLVLARSGERLAVAAGQTALAALEQAGHDLPSSCRTGMCGTCTVKLIAGKPEHRDRVLTTDQRAAGAFTPCVSRAHSAELVLDL
jgi:ferredoxin-NADP reductase/predicted pyridoxine 5'-phosphate oxidase superfamily flavin-nucleotide-binding protein